MKALEQRLHAGFIVDVDPVIGGAVAGEKLLQTQRARGMTRSDQDDIAALRLDESHAPQDEGAHEELAELGIPLHQLAQVIVINDEDFARLVDARAHEAARAAQRAQLPREFSGPMQYHALIAGKARPQDFETPLALA